MHKLTQASRDWIEVLVDSPGAKSLYTYLVPNDTDVQPGAIVSVPFGRSQVGGIAIRQLEKLPEGLDPSSIKQIESVVNTSFFTKNYWDLLVRVARYYQTPFVRVVRSALPPGLLSKSQRRVRLNQARINIDSASSRDNGSQKQTELLLAKQIVEAIAQSPSGDYSWPYIQRQMMRQCGQNGRFSSGLSTRQSINQALQYLIELGAVESYVATPRSPKAQKRQAVVLVDTAADSLLDRALSSRQQALLQDIERAGGELWLSDALQLFNTTSKTLKKIAEKGYIAIEPKELLRSGSHSQALPDRPKVLTADQAAALAVLQQMSGYQEALLHGVTGSGKTEVYLQAIAPVLQAKKSALVLVPEIGLTPQLTDRFRSRFGSQVCVYHSGLSEGERYDTWRQMLSGEPQVIVGTRSAIFSPLPNLGIIVLDEEHDGSFKQDQPMPCYHARKVAQWRAALENCPLILGSATPSIETWVRFQGLEQASASSPFSILSKKNKLTEDSLTEDSLTEDRLTEKKLKEKKLEENRQSAKNVFDSEVDKTPVKKHYLPLPKRVRDRPAPPVEAIDMRQELLAGNRTIFSRALQQALEDLIEQGNQGILFIHRRGHSSFVSCRSCGHVMECPNCDVSLSFHQTHQTATARLKCHYCGHGEAHPKVCPACRSPYIKNFGSGTQRVVNDLAKYLPQARCIRFDSDTTRNKGAHRALLARFAKGEADLLVGTQMLTKGIDLPQVTLVGAIAADGLLFMPDYRASERAFQTLTQVAGRAGRGEQKGRVIVQTYSPEHAAIKALIQGTSGSHQTQQMSQIETYGAFLQAEMSDRLEQQYPPYGKLILLKLSGLDATATERAAERIAAHLQAQLAESQSTSLGQLPCQIMGPVPAPIFRVARRYRWHILLKLSLKTPMPDLTPLRKYCSQGISLTIDVEPLNLS